MIERRFIAQRALSRQMLHLDLPVEITDISWARSAAGALRGSLVAAPASDLADDGRPLLEEWSTLVYEEVNGEITWGGIVTRVTAKPSTIEFEANSFLTYPVGIPFGDVYSKSNADPAEVYKMLWQHVQAQPDGDLGVAVSFPVSTNRPALGTDKPYELNWWNATDVGQTMSTLLTEAHLIAEERHTWNAQDQITHEIRLHETRMGTQRNDLAFRDGENVVEASVKSAGSNYANVVFGLGAGEGAGAIRSQAINRDGRLRRVDIYTDKTVTSADTMVSLANRELARRAVPFEIESITVKDHPHARIGSWSLDDDIRVDLDVRGYGELSLWCRVTGWTRLSDTSARLTLSRAESAVL